SPLKFIVNPNSPTGALFDAQHVEAAVAASSGVVAIDEAYVDFAPRSALDLLASRGNVLLLRTFSKSYGLAGMRIGFALGSRGRDPQHRRHARAAREAARRTQGDPGLSTPTREETWDLVTSMTKSDQLRRHMRSVEAAMRAYARRFGEDEERWGVLGLIHDW